MKKSLAIAAIAIASFVDLGVTSMASPQPPGQQIAVPKAEVLQPATPVDVDQLAPALAPESITLVTQDPATKDITLAKNYDQGAQDSFAMNVATTIPANSSVAFAVQDVITAQGVVGSTYTAKNSGVTQGAPPTTAAEVISSDQKDMLS